MIIFSARLFKIMFNQESKTLITNGQEIKSSCRHEFGHAGDHGTIPTNRALNMQRQATDERPLSQHPHPRDAGNSHNESICSMCEHCI